MLEITLKGVEALKNLVTSWRAEKRQIDADKAKALNAVLSAATKTRAYLADIRDGREQLDREKEAEIQGLWVKAADSLIPIGSYELADRCMVKADCWADSKLWEDARYASMPLSLDSIIDECRSMLNPQRET